MPVLLMTAEDVDVWLNGTLEEALKLQKSQPDEALVIHAVRREEGSLSAPSAPILGLGLFVL
jgi:putative SOS response-associated peptidase YedK